jgi:hypothetical protein
MTVLPSGASELHPRVPPIPFPAGQEPLNAPRMERFHSGRPVAEVFGITPLADRLAQRGPAGEELSGLLNAYLAFERALFSTARSVPYHAVGVRLV